MLKKIIDSDRTESLVTLILLLLVSGINFEAAMCLGIIWILDELKRIGKLIKQSKID